MIKTKDRSFQDYGEYFDHMAEVLQVEPFHRNFESDTVQSDNLALHVDVLTCDKYAPTIVFVPGTAIYALCYAEILYKIYQAGYNVVGMDPRGHGRSEGVRGDYTVPELMTDISNVVTYAIERFSSKVSLMGSSQGGILSLYMAAKDERLNSVICQNIADLTDEKTIHLTRHPKFFKYLKTMLSTAGQLLPNAQIPVASYIDMDSIPVKHFGNIHNFINQDPLALKHISLRALKSLSHTQPAVPFEKIKVPVFVFQGDADSIFSVKYTQELFDKLTCKKEMVIFEGKTHSLMSEDVDEILPSILHWLKEVYPVVEYHL